MKRKDEKGETFQNGREDTGSGAVSECVRERVKIRESLMFDPTTKDGSPTRHLQRLYRFLLLLDFSGS